VSETTLKRGRGSSLAQTETTLKRGRGGSLAQTVSRFLAGIEALNSNWNFGRESRIGGRE